MDPQAYAREYNPVWEFDESYACQGRPHKEIETLARKSKSLLDVF
jgi:hypothetical protein